MQITAELIKRHSRPVPRYTSYPTANHFNPHVRDIQYIDWLSALGSDTSLSLYLHIPFCDALCFYCACSTKATKRYEPVTRYVGALETEIGNVSALLPQRLPVKHVHWGGGSPSILQAADIDRIGAALGAAFDLVSVSEHAVEIDPRHLSEEKVAAFARVGVNRVSMGVQDFDPKVQNAIGREQTLAVTRRAVDLFRNRGVSSVNIDLVYGLPHQTTESLRRTIEQVLELAPDRIAAFGYAHLPQRVRPQRLIDATTLPDLPERFEQASLIVSLLEAAGYRRLGIDHFARAGDGLAEKPLRRNFQGYTSDAADGLIGLGASAIGKLPGGFVQNAVSALEYERLISSEGLATVRGIALTDDDRARAWAIERLMCDFRLSARDFVEAFGEGADPVLADAANFAETDGDGLLRATEDGFELTDRGRPFVRSICSALDRYFSGNRGGHSAAV